MKTHLKNKKKKYNTNGAEVQKVYAVRACSC